MRRLLLPVAAALASATLAALPPSGAPQVAGEPPLGGRLEQRLERIAAAFEAGGAPAAGDAAARNGLPLTGGAARVIIESDDLPGAMRAARAAGAVEAQHAGLVQALVPVPALRLLAASPGVRFVRPPLAVVPMVTGEGVGLTGAEGWHTAGVSGAGVRVAVLDLGFTGYEALLGTELPAQVTTMSFRADEDLGGGGVTHGVEVAQIVHEMAPGADLYLANFETEVELANAVAWLDAQGVRVVNASWGYFVSGPGDGTGVVDDVIAASIAGGTLWSIASGNHALRHWSGPFRDDDGDLFHEFQPAPQQDEGNEVVGGFFGLLAPGEKVLVELKWDDPFGAACEDYDLYLKHTDNLGQPVIAASSENVQNDGTDCVPGADPIETLSFTVAELDVYHIVIKESHAARDAFMHLYSGYHDTEYRVTAGSVSQPADIAESMALGAVFWGTANSVESFSSQGPNADGAVRPDLVGPDGVTTATAQLGFFGTSAAAPHGAGAAALVLERMPCFTPADVKSFLEGRAADLGLAGKDNISGAGRLQLGALPPDSDGDGRGDPCEVPGDADGDGCTDAQEAGAVPELGGGRDSADHFDFYDVTHDRQVDLSDVLLILAHFGHGPSDDPADDQLDRDAPDENAPYLSAAAADGVDLTDALANLASFGHACTP